MPSAGMHLKPVLFLMPEGIALNPYWARYISSFLATYGLALLLIRSAPFYADIA